MVERIKIKEVALNDGSTPTVEREIDVVRNSEDPTAKFLYSVRQEMERGLYFHTRKGKYRHGSLRPRRELRDIKAQYPTPDEMREVVKSLKGEGKHVIVYKKEDEIVGFTLAEEKKK
jgi:hypothetical protein